MNVMKIIESAYGKPMSALRTNNANSVAMALEAHGARFGMMLPHRLAQYLCQIFHESGAFRYDREVWGPTPAQQRYEGRKDLGNTQKGDGKKFKGHGPMQVTGRANTTAFYKWCAVMFPQPQVPDFVSQPQLINTDPWEGLTGIWYWSEGNPTGTSLNVYADSGDIEMITRRINGGLNGYADRLAWYDRVALVLLGYRPHEVLKFQKQHGLTADGVSGPRTRAAMHVALSDMSDVYSPHMQTAPVTSDRLKPVAPPQVDKPLTKTTGFWERVTSLIGLSGIGGAAWFQDWRTVLAVAAVLGGLAIVGLILHKQIIDAVKTLKTELTS